MNSHCDVIAREMNPEELDVVLVIRNEIFAPITEEMWNREEKATASLAFIGDEAVGAIPLFLREFIIAPGVTITAAFENAVGTKAGYRGRGIGSTMINSAKEFLKGKADALFVYRGDERSTGYNFYRKQGHIDLHYTRQYICTNYKGKVDNRVIVSTGIDEIANNEDRLLRIFQDNYGNYGGFPIRHKGYYEKALNAPYYLSRPFNYYFFRLIEEGNITAYLIAAKSQRSQDNINGEFVNILEMATINRDSDRIETVLQSASVFANENKLGTLRAIIGDKHPFREALYRTGFEAKGRGMQVMALSFDSKSLFEKLWKHKFNMPGIELKVWTLEQEFIMLEAQGDKAKSITLEMKEEVLTRWLLGRIDFRARVNEGTITVLNGDDSIIDEIAKRIPLSDWEYHQIDYT